MKYLNWLKKYKDYIVVLILIIIVIIGYLWANQVTAKNKEENENDVELVTNAEIEEEPIKIKVDIKGEVNKPNVYELEENSRIIDLIKKAGGLTKNANTDIINLSKKLKDQDVVIIYNNDEMKAFKEEQISKYSVETKVIKCPDVINDGCINSNQISNETNNKSNIETEDTSKQETNIKTEETKEEILKININEATKEELMTLSGVGESKAINIINYRLENGEFKNIEDIKNVTGIGDSVYEKIKDNITI